MKMKLQSSVLSLFALAALPFSSALPASSGSLDQGQVTLSYDTRYDDPGLPLTAVACSDGENGLMKHGSTALGQVPGFPRVGGAFTVEKWDSKSCGKCYMLMYKSHSIYVTAVDYAGTGFNIGKKAMDELTHGRAEADGRVQVAWADAAPRFCGF
jgi:hypothetical protein